MFCSSLPDCDVTQIRSSSCCVLCSHILFITCWASKQIHSIFVIVILTLTLLLILEVLYSQNKVWSPVGLKFTSRGVSFLLLHLMNDKHCTYAVYTTQFYSIKLISIYGFFQPEPLLPRWCHLYSWQFLGFGNQSSSFHPIESYWHIQVQFCITPTNF